MYTGGTYFSRNGMVLANSSLLQVHPISSSKLMRRGTGDVLASSMADGSNCNGPQNGVKRPSWQKS